MTTRTICPAIARQPGRLTPVCVHHPLAIRMKPSTTLIAVNPHFPTFIGPCHPDSVNKELHAKAQHSAMKSVTKVSRTSGQSDPILGFRHKISPPFLGPTPVEPNRQGECPILTHPSTLPSTDLFVSPLVCRWDTLVLSLCSLAHLSQTTMCYCAVTIGSYYCCPVLRRKINQMPPFALPVCLALRRSLQGQSRIDF